MSTLRMILIVAAAIILAIVAWQIIAFVTAVIFKILSLLVLAAVMYVVFLIARSALGRGHHKAA